MIRQAWQYLLGAWEHDQSEFEQRWYELKRVIDKDGWNSAVIRGYSDITRPYLKAESAFWNRPVAPKRDGDFRIEDFVRLSVVYPDPRHTPNIPNEWLASTVRDLRENLELATQLELELGGYATHNISPIIPDDGLVDGDYYGRSQGLSGNVLLFAALFERLIGLDLNAATHEFGAWPANDDRVFDRLRIWASGNSVLVPSEVFGATIARVGDAAFWGSHDQRDLLLVLAKRWSDAPEQTRRQIEERLLRGPGKWSGEGEFEFEERKAGASLNRLTWLANNGCKFTFDLEAESKKLQIVSPRWKPEYGINAAESIEGRGGWVRTEGEHSGLLREPLHNLLAKALELSRRADDTLVENDPFGGLSAQHPVLAFSALNNAAKREDFPEWAWRTFLNSEARKNDKPKFSALIADRMSRYQNHSVARIMDPAADWLLGRSKDLANLYPRTLDRILMKLIDVLRSQPIASGVRGNKDPDWTMEAINRPAGKIAQALLHDTRAIGVEGTQGFPREWLAYVDGLLSLSGDSRRYALVIFAHHLNWFHAFDPRWTNNNLLSVLDGNDQSDRNAVWSGFLWGANIPNQSLFIRLKPDLLALAKESSLARLKYQNVLSGIILAGWGSTNKETGERFISDSEMHDVLLETDDEFRAQMLWQLGVWSKSEDGRGEKWRAMIPELLSNVWPRQNSVKTPRISAALCDLAFSSTKHFPEIAKATLPLLTIIEKDHFVPHDLLDSGPNIVDTYPRQVLEILFVVLPESVGNWPYGMGDVLNRIANADHSLRVDDRLLELNRRWNSR